MIQKKTMREFDSLFNQYEKWPMELSYRMYCMIIDDINQKLEERNEEVDRRIDSCCDPAAQRLR